MKRRVIKLGTATLVTSLPSKWVQQFGIKQGDYLDVVERNRDLVISTEKAVAVSEKVLDCRNLNTRLIDEHLFAAYMRGYKTIEILHQPKLKEYKTKNIRSTTEFLQERINYFIGVEIIEQSETRTVVKELAEVSEEELTNTLRRIFLLTKDMGNALYGAITAKDSDALSGMVSRHRNIRKFMLYFTRVINSQGFTDFSKTNSITALVENLWFVSGTYRVIAENTLKMKGKYSAKALEALKITVEVVNRFSDLYYKYDADKAMELMDLREKIHDIVRAERNKMKANDAMLYPECSFIGGHIMHCLRAKFALEL